MAGEDQQEGTESAQTAEEAQIPESVVQAIENAQDFATVNVPEGFVKFTKALPDGTEAHMLMSQRSVQALGGEKNIQRVFDNAADEQRFTFLFTEADLEFALSDEYRHEGESNIDAKIRYMEENFGDVIRLMDDEYDDTPRDELVETWTKLFQHNNFHLVGEDNESFGLISLNLEEFFKDFDDLSGSRQQQIDFLLGHELDHGDNLDTKSDGPKGLFAEVLSDRTGINGIKGEAHPLMFWSKRVSHEEFAESLIAQRIEHEITRILIYNEIGKYPDNERWDHNTGPFLFSDDAQGVDKLTKKAGEGLAELETLVEAKGDDRLHDILAQNYTLPVDADTLIYGSSIMAGMFVDELFTDVLDRMDISEERYDVYEDRYYDLDSDDLAGAKQLLEDLREEFPEQTAQAVRVTFYSEIFDDVEELFEDPILPPPYVEALEAELEAIENIEDDDLQARSLADFVERFMRAQPEIFQRLIFKEAPEIAVMTAVEIDPDAWEKTVEQIAAEIASQSEIKDPDTKRAFDTFIEQRSLEIRPDDHSIDTPDADTYKDEAALPTTGLSV